MYGILIVALVSFSFSVSADGLPIRNNPQSLQRGLSSEDHSTSEKKRALWRAYYRVLEEGDAVAEFKPVLKEAIGHPHDEVAAAAVKIDLLLTSDYQAALRRAHERPVLYSEILVSRIPGVPPNIDRYFDDESQYVDELFHALQVSPNSDVRKYCLFRLSTATTLRLEMALEIRKRFWGELTERSKALLIVAFDNEPAFSDAIPELFAQLNDWNADRARDALKFLVYHRHQATVNFLHQALVKTGKEGISEHFLAVTRQIPAAELTLWSEDPSLSATARQILVDAQWVKGAQLRLRTKEVPLNAREIRDLLSSDDKHIVRSTAHILAKRRLSSGDVFDALLDTRDSAEEWRRPIITGLIRKVKTRDLWSQLESGTASEKEVVAVRLARVAGYFRADRSLEVWTEILEAFLESKGTFSAAFLADIPKALLLDLFRGLPELGPAPCQAVARALMGRHIPSPWSDWIVAAQDDNSIPPPNPKVLQLRENPKVSKRANLRAFLTLQPPADRYLVHRAIEVGVGEYLDETWPKITELADSLPGIGTDPQIREWLIEGLQDSASSAVRAGYGRLLLHYYPAIDGTFAEIVTHFDSMRFRSLSKMLLEDLERVNTEVFWRAAKPDDLRAIAAITKRFFSAKKRSGITNASVFGTFLRAISTQAQKSLSTCPAKLSRSYAQEREDYVSDLPFTD